MTPVSSIVAPGEGGDRKGPGCGRQRGAWLRWPCGAGPRARAAGRGAQRRDLGREAIVLRPDLEAALRNLDSDPVRGPDRGVGARPLTAATAPWAWATWTTAWSAARRATWRNTP